MAKIIFSEHELLARLTYEAHEPKTLIDVGAHMGNFSRRFLEMGWRVIAFEPDPENYAALAQRFAQYQRSSEPSIGPRSSDPDSRALRKAVSDVSGTGTFFRSTEFWGIHSLKPFHPTHTDQIEVEITRLDDELDRLAIDRVTVLKIDAEGADFLALRSFPFSRLRPEVVMTEFMDARTEPHFGYTHHDVVRFMADLGYCAYVSEWAPITAHSTREGGGGPYHFLQCVPYPLHHAAAWGNLIFLMEDRRESFEVTLNAVLVDLERRREASATAPSAKSKGGGWSGGRSADGLADSPMDSSAGTSANRSHDPSCDGACRGACARSGRGRFTRDAQRAWKTLSSKTGLDPLIHQIEARLKEVTPARELVRWGRRKVAAVKRTF